MGHNFCLEFWGHHTLLSPCFQDYCQNSNVLREWSPHPEFYPVTRLLGFTFLGPTMLVPFTFQNSILCSSRLQYLLVLSNIWLFDKWECFPCMYVCITCIPGASGGQKSVSELPEPESQIVVSRHADAGYQTLVQMELNCWVIGLALS